MLELSMIQSTTRSKDAAVNASEKTNSKGEKEEAGQKFQDEYDSATKGKESAEQTAEPAEAPAEEDALPEQKPDPDQVGATEPEPQDLSEADAEELSTETYAFAMADASNSRANANAQGDSVALDNRQGQVQDKQLVLSGDNANATMRGAEGPGEGEVAVPKASTLVTKTTAETVVMTKAVENAAKNILTAVPDGAVSVDRGSSATADIAQTTLPSRNATPPAAEGPKADLSLVGAIDRKRSAEELPRGVELRRTAPEQPIVPTSTAVEIKPALNQPMTLPKASMLKEKSDVASPVLTELETINVMNSRPSDQLSTTALHQVINRAETPTMIARQMAEALQRLPDRPVEISLNPKELGRVRMNISAAEAGITVTVVAERPETLDLMRRNIDQLTREFQALGYDTINFSFAEGEAKNSFDQEASEQSGAGVTHLEMLPEDEEAGAQQRPMVATTGLDIRI